MQKKGHHGLSYSLPRALLDWGFLGPHRPKGLGAGLPDPKQMVVKSTVGQFRGVTFMDTDTFVFITHMRNFRTLIDLIVFMSRLLYEYSNLICDNTLIITYRSVVRTHGLFRGLTVMNMQFFCRPIQIYIYIHVCSNAYLYFVDILIYHHYIHILSFYNICMRILSIYYCNIYTKYFCINT